MNAINPVPVKPIAFQLLRRNTIFRNYWFARLVSMIGDRFYFLALPWLVLEITNGSVISTSITLALEMIPLLITLPFMGVAIDRFERRRLMLIADVARGIIMGIIFILIFTNTISVYYVYIAAMLMSILSQMFDTTSQSYLPRIVEKPDLLEANANVMSVSSFLSTVGHLISGLVIIIFTVAGSIIINSLSFFLSALLLRNLPTATGATGNTNFNDKWGQIKEGFRYLVKHETLFSLAIFTALMNLAITGTQSLFIFTSKEVLDLTAAETSLIFMIGGIFSFTATLLVKRVGKRLNKGQMIRFGSLGVFIALLIIWWNPSLINLIVGFSILIFIAAFVMVSMATYRQEIIPNELMGRVSASYQLFTLSTAPIAIIGGGYLASVTEVKTVFLVAACIIGCNVLFAWFGKIRLVK